VLRVSHQACVAMRASLPRAAASVLPTLVTDSWSSCNSFIDSSAALLRKQRYSEAVVADYQRYCRPPSQYSAVNRTELIQHRDGFQCRRSFVSRRTEPGAELRRHATNIGETRCCHRRSARASVLPAVCVHHRAFQELALGGLSPRRQNIPWRRVSPRHKSRPAEMPLSTMILFEQCHCPSHQQMN